LAASGLIALVLGMIGCGSVRYPPAPAETGPFEYWYLIGPGDSVNIQVWRNPELSMTVTVRPDGKITSPLVEDVPASGKTPTALAREMEKHLSKYVQSPVVTVIVAGFAGPYTQQIRVIGEAAKPQSLPYRENMTLLDVMIIVGGITDFAAGNQASILRIVDGKKGAIGRADHRLGERGRPEGERSDAPRRRTRDPAELFLAPLPIWRKVGVSDEFSIRNRVLLGLFPHEYGAAEQNSVYLSDILPV